MSNFRDYAPIYDAIGDEWLSLQLLQILRRWLSELQLQPASAADLACGTGAVAVALALDGLQVYGVDRAPAMLQIARRRAREAAAEVCWIEQDLRELALPQPVELVTCFYDSLNYLLSAEELALVIQRAGGALAPGGVLAFDLNTPREYASWGVGLDVVAHDGPELFVLSRRRFNANSGLASGQIVWMAREGALWRRGQEQHQQRAHSDAEVCQALEAAGLRLAARLTPLGQPAGEQATRVLYLARKGEE